MIARSDVLIIGAGPTGLVLALWLAKLGVSVRLIDKAAEPGTTSRAVAVQARTLELYRQLGLTDRVIAEGHHVPAVNLGRKGNRKRIWISRTLAQASPLIRFFKYSRKTNMNGFLSTD